MRYIDWDHDRLDLEWDTPRYDGGAKITHYTVEMRLGKPGASWEPVRFVSYRIYILHLNVLAHFFRIEFSNLRKYVYQYLRSLV